MNYNLYTVFESVSWLYRILGSYPLVIRKSETSAKYVLSTIFVTYNILFFIISTRYSLNYITLVKNNYDLESDSLSVLTLLVRHFSSAICIFDATIMKIIYSKKIIIAIEDLSLQDKHLQELGYSFNYKRDIKVNLTAIISFLTIGFSLINTEFISYYNIQIPTSFQIFINFTILIQLANISLFSFLIVQVGLRFRAINMTLNCAVKYDKKIFKLPMSYHSPEEFLVSIEKVHAKLCVIAKVFNSIFVITIVVSIAKAFILTTAMLYFVYLGLKHKSEYIEEVLIYTALITEVGIVLSIILSCTWSSKQGHATTKIFNRISLEKIYKDNEAFQELIEVFSLQVAHHDLNFSAGGLFPLSPVTLQILAGNITTYLVIMIQFDPKLY